MNWVNIFSYIPEVQGPSEKKLGFNVKLKWTLIILLSFFVLANIPLFGLSENALKRFEYLAIILGTDFGSIISLGIGPIVMASIILQLLTGSGIINIDTTTVEGRKFFQGVQKLLILFFIIFESVVYVLFKALQPAPGLAEIMIIQLILGGLAIYYMNEVCEKWGFGSGVSLFIAAGVSWRLFSGAFQFINVGGQNCLTSFTGEASTVVFCPGKVLAVIQSLVLGMPIELISAMAALISTAIIFMIVVWAQSLRVEVPLTFGRIRGYGIKWPLSFFYASVIPVILASALIANIQLFGGILENAAKPCQPDELNNMTQCTGAAKIASKINFLGKFDSNGQPISGLSFWLGHTNLLEVMIRSKGDVPSRLIIQGITHLLSLVILCALFSVFWVKTAGMDSKSQAKKISASGLQVAGFRQDNRVIESILDRYIMPLTVMGGIAIGFLAALTDLLGALVSGTAILLLIMILFQFYQNIAQQHSLDMNPTLKKFIKT